MLIPVILSGGSGTRLWPVSRSAYPKPFMRMSDGESLLHKTLDRALRLADGGRVLTVTGRDYYFLNRDASRYNEGGRNFNANSDYFRRTCFGHRNRNFRRAASHCSACACSATEASPARTRSRTPRISSGDVEGKSAIVPI